MKIIKTLSLLFFAGAVIASCKKDDAGTNWAEKIKNTVWIGEFHYTSRASEPVSIAFKEGGQFTWHELAGEFPGSWKIENDVLTVSFPSGSGFTTTLTSDGQMSAIQNFPVNSYAMDNAALNKDADVSLDNTVWTGTNIVVRFKSGSLLDIELGTIPVKHSSLAYVRKAKTIRFTSPPTFKVFLVHNSTLVMKGAVIDGSTLLTFPLNKQ
jgi:hypothetical protein